MKIVLAMDTSSASQAALEEIAARPWPVDSCFEVVGVVEPSHLWTTSEVALEAERCARETIDRAVERLRDANKEASGAVFSGDPKTVILDRARGADLLVVGSQGGSQGGSRGGSRRASPVARFLLGNVAATAMRYAPCSVEIARPRKKTGNFRILLATDGSPFSEQAAKSIASRLWPDGTEVLVLSAVELILPSARAMFEVPLIDTAFLEKARGEAMQHSQDAVARAREILSATGVSVGESISVLADAPKAVILQEARAWGADLIVLGSHGHHGMDRFLVGSVSEYVATHAECSVEVVR